MARPPEIGTNAINPSHSTAGAGSAGARRATQRAFQPRGGVGLHFPMKPPAFQFYADDFLAGTMDLTQSEVGSFIRLLCHQWSRGSIPADDKRCELIAGGPITDAVLAKFPVGEGGRQNMRLERERQKQSEYREAQSARGRAGAASRWHRHSASNGTGIAQASFCQWPGDGSPSPSPSPSPKYTQLPIERQGVQGDVRTCSLPVAHSPATSDGETLSVEPPNGFPKTQGAARDIAGLLGVTPEFSERTWLLAASRGWTDAKGQPIRSWRHYVASCAAFERDRVSRQREADKGRSNGKPGPKVRTYEDGTPRSEAMDLVREIERKAREGTL